MFGPKNLEIFLANIQTIWVKEIDFLIVSIEEEAENLPINLDKLLILGHSLGGLTSIEAARNIPSIKYVLASDPSIECYQKGEQIKLS